MHNFYFSPALFRYTWQTKGIYIFKVWNVISFLGIFLYCEMIITVKLNNTLLTSHRYDLLLLFGMVRKFKFNSLNFRYCDTLLLRIITKLCINFFKTYSPFIIETFCSVTNLFAFPPPRSLVNLKHLWL